MKSLTVLVFVLVCDYTLAAKLPPEFKICKKTDPDLNTCFKEAVGVALPLLKDGIPDLNVPPAEPLVIDAMTVKGSGGAVNLDQNFKNIKIYHVTEGVIKDANFIMGEGENSFEVTIKGLLGECHVDAEYNFDGKVLMLPITGDGKAFIDLKDSTVLVNMKGEKFQKKGKDHMKITDLTVDIEPSDAHFQFENLFNGDEAMGKNMNNMINENWKDLFGEVKEGYNTALAAVVKNVASTIFNKVPMEDLFPQ